MQEAPPAEEPVRFRDGPDWFQPVSQLVKKEEADLEAMLRELQSPWACRVCSTINPYSNEICDVCDEGERPTLDVDAAFLNLAGDKETFDVSDVIRVTEVRRAPLTVFQQRCRSIGRAPGADAT